MFLLIITAAHWRGAARPAQRIQFVDEDNAGRGFTRLFKQVADPGGAHADKHLNKLGPVDGKERYPRLAGNGAGQKRLARARWANQHDAFGHARAKPAIGAGILQEFDDFHEFPLGFVDTGDIVEGHLGVLLHIDLGLAFPHGHEAAHAGLVGETADYEHPQGEENRDRNDPGKQIGQEAAFNDAGEFDVVFLKILGQHGFDPHREYLRIAVGIGITQCAADMLVGNGDLFDLPVMQQRLKFAIRDCFDGLPVTPPLLGENDGPYGDDDIPEVDLVFLFHAKGLPSGRILWPDTLCAPHSA